MKKEHNLPEIELRKQALIQLNSLREEAKKLELEKETLNRQLNTFDRPRSAIRETLATLDESSK
jgi:hypothetical protein